MQKIIFKIKMLLKIWLKYLMDAFLYFNYSFLCFSEYFLLLCFSILMMTLLQPPLLISQWELWGEFVTLGWTLTWNCDTLLDVIKAAQQHILQPLLHFKQLNFCHKKEADSELPVVSVVISGSPVFVNKAHVTHVDLCLHTAAVVFFFFSFSCR